LLALSVAAILFAQADANKGQLVGTVYDQNQAVIPEAKVGIKNTATGLTRDLNTNELGQYRAVLLDPGQYDITVEKQGFALSTHTGITLSVGTTVNLDVTLSVGATAQTIEVGATLIDVTLPTAASVINTAAIRDLPINGRRFQDFALLAPTIQVEPDRGQLSFAGQRGINSNVMIDGTDYNQPFFGGIRGGERSNSIFTVPQSAIQEFQVITIGYAAEYGRSTGGVLNAITKSGTNNYHGDAFYQLRHKETGLQTPFKRQILETQHQWGGALGGPIHKDKMFWFAAFERQDASTPRQILFGALAGLAPNANTAEAYNYFKSLEGPFSSTNDGSALTSRLDYQFQAGHRLSLRYNFSDANAANAISVGGAADTLTNTALNNNGSEKDRTHSGVTQFTSILSPRMANDLRFAGSWEERPRTSNSAVAGFNNNTIGSFGTRLFFPNYQEDKRIQIADSLSLSRGPHTFKFGADYNWLTASQAFGFNQFGIFSTTSSNVTQILDILSAGGSIANRFDDPTVQYQRQIGNLLAAFNMTQFAFYAQDSWRATQKLTLDLGVRWEGQWNPAPEANNTDVINRVKGFRFPNGLSVDPTRDTDNLNQIMPRFGFAWSTGSKNDTVVRGYTGMFYAATPLLLFAGANNNFRLPPGDVSLSLPRAGSTVYRDLLAIGVDLNAFSLDKLPTLSIEQVQRAAAGGGAAIDPFRGARLIANADDYRNPRAFQAGLGADHQITDKLMAGVQLNYVNTVHLQRNRDYNLQAPTVRAGDQRPITNRSPRPIASLDRITVRETNARSMYRGATFTSRYRFSNRLQFGVSYTVSQAFSDDDNERNATGLFHDDPFNMRNEYGYSILDRRHQFTTNALTFLPWGVELSGIVRALSGRPVDPAAGADLNNDGNAADRAYQAPGMPFKRYSFRNRGFFAADLRFLKNFSLGERARFQFSCEMFNLFDNDNILYAGRNLNYGPGIDANTGAVVPALETFRRLRLPTGEYDPVNNQLGTPFQAQFGLRLFF
jgi:hypothetical protein